MSTEATSFPIEVRRHGVVAVVGSATETAHYPLINRGISNTLNVPWLALEFFDEFELEDLLRLPPEERFAAIVFTPGAIQLPGVRAAIEQHANVLARALANGVGLVFNATSLGGLDRFDLSFLPEGGQVSLLGTGMRPMTGTLQCDGCPDQAMPAAEDLRVSSAVTLAVRGFGWADMATLQRADGVTETVTRQAQFGRGRVIVSALPFEWLGSPGLIHATRSRGCLVMGAAAAPAWYDDVEPGAFLVRIPAPDHNWQTIAELMKNFSHLRLRRDMPWSALDYLTRDDLLARLENHGSIEFAADGPGDPIYSRLQGEPRYLIRLRQAQAQLVSQILNVPESPTFHLLALAILSRTCDEVVRGKLFVPDLLRFETLRSLVDTAVVRRVRDGSVDGLLLPTVNLLAACSIAGADNEATDSMMAWVEANAAAAAPDHRAQSRWSARAADRYDLLALIKEPDGPPVSILGQLSYQLDAGALDPIQPPAWPEAAPENTTDESSVRVQPKVLSPLEIAILAYTHARWSSNADPNSIWEALKGTRHPSSGNIASAGNNVEELCLRTAAETLLDAKAPLTVHPQSHEAPVADPQPTVKLLTLQAAAEIEAQNGRRAEQELQNTVKEARIMAGVFASLTISVCIALVSLPLWVPLPRLGLDSRLTITVITFGIVSALGALALRTDAVERVSPSWVQVIGGLVGAHPPTRRMQASDQESNQSLGKGPDPAPRI